MREARLGGVLVFLASGGCSIIGIIVLWRYNIAWTCYIWWYYDCKQNSEVLYNWGSLFSASLLLKIDEFVSEYIHKMFSSAGEKTLAEQ